MSSSHKVRVSIEIASPQAVVWEHVSEHEDTPRWVDAVRSVKLARTGTPRNGVGAIRVVKFKPRLWTTIHEEIIRFEAPTAFEYVLFKGMPGLVSHLGRLSVDAVDEERSRLSWDVDFAFRTVHPFRLFVPSFLRDFERVLTQGVARLKEQLEQGSRGTPETEASRGTPASRA
jgi:uncharacterized membrane protein